MKDIFQIRLSARELFVLAALLGYESIFGIGDDALLTSGIELKSQIKQTVQQLERKKLIRYDLDGTLYIKPDLRRTIDCICCAETVGCFSTNMGSGKKTAIYVLEKDSYTVTVENAGSGKYRVHLTDSIDASKIIPTKILNVQDCEMDEMLLLEEAQAAQTLIEAFNAEEAKLRIDKHTQDNGSSEIISQVLSKKCGFMSFQIHRRTKELYKAVCNGLFVNVENRTISVSIDNNDVLHFKAVSANGVLNYINPYLHFYEEEGVQ